MESGEFMKCGQFCQWVVYRRQLHVCICVFVWRVSNESQAQHWNASISHEG